MVERVRVDGARAAARPDPASRPPAWSVPGGGLATWLLLLVLSPAAGQTTPGPTATVEQAISRVIAVLRDPSLDREARWSRIAPIIDASFDFQSMSQRVLATRWQSASPAERRQFVEYFSQYLEVTYRGKIEAYQGERVRVKGERVKDDRAVVSTAVVTDTVEIPIDYRMRLAEDGKWYAYDVVIEGVSLVNNYRNTFAAIERSSGMDGLLSDIQQRIERHRRSDAPARAGATATE